MAGWLATDGIRYYRSPLLGGLPEVVHGFFTRQGGVSTGAYDSLNVSLAVGDGREAVAENLGRMRQALGLAELASAAQVHGSRAAVITSPGQARLSDIPEVDILVTTVPGLGLLIKQADCQAVMFYDPVNRVVANVHCGWRGQVENILGETVALLHGRGAGRRDPEHGGRERHIRLRHRARPGFTAAGDRPRERHRVPAGGGPAAGSRPDIRTSHPRRRTRSRTEWGGTRGCRSSCVQATGRCSNGRSLDQQPGHEGRPPWATAPDQPMQSDAYLPRRPTDNRVVGGGHLAATAPHLGT